jgi:hypothetical protein
VTLAAPLSHAMWRASSDAGKPTPPGEGF